MPKYKALLKEEIDHLYNATGILKKQERELKLKQRILYRMANIPFAPPVVQATPPVVYTNGDALTPDLMTEERGMR